MSGSMMCVWHYMCEWVGTIERGRENEKESRLSRSAAIVWYYEKRNNVFKVQMLPAVKIYTPRAYNEHRRFACEMWFFMCSFAHWCHSHNTSIFYITHNTWKPTGFYSSSCASPHKIVQTIGKHWGRKCSLWQHSPRTHWHKYTHSKQ